MLSTGPGWRLVQPLLPRRRRLRGCGRAPRSGHRLAVLVGQASGLGNAHRRPVPARPVDRRPVECETASRRPTRLMYRALWTIAAMPELTVPVSAGPSLGMAVVGTWFKLVRNSVLAAALITAAQVGIGSGVVDSGDTDSSTWRDLLTWSRSSSPSASSAVPRSASASSPAGSRPTPAIPAAGVLAPAVRFWLRVTAAVSATTAPWPPSPGLAAGTGGPPEAGRPPAAGDHRARRRRRPRDRPAALHHRTGVGRRRRQYARVGVGVAARPDDRVQVSPDLGLLEARGRAGAWWLAYFVVVLAAILGLAVAAPAGLAGPPGRASRSPESWTGPGRRRLRRHRLDPAGHRTKNRHPRRHLRRAGRHAGRDCSRALVSVCVAVPQVRRRRVIGVVTPMPPRPSRPVAMNRPGRWPSPPLRRPPYAPYVLEARRREAPYRREPAYYTDPVYLEATAGTPSPEPRRTASPEYAADPYSSDAFTVTAQTFDADVFPRRARPALSPDPARPRSCRPRPCRPRSCRRRRLPPSPRRPVPPPCRPRATVPAAPPVPPVPPVPASPPPLRRLPPPVLAVPAGNSGLRHGDGYQDRRIEGHRADRVRRRPRTAPPRPRGRPSPVPAPARTGLRRRAARSPPGPVSAPAGLRCQVLAPAPGPVSAPPGPCRPPPCRLRLVGRGAYQTGARRAGLDDPGPLRSELGQPDPVHVPAARTSRPPAWRGGVRAAGRWTRLQDGLWRDRRRGRAAHPRAARPRQQAPRPQGRPAAKNAAATNAAATPAPAQPVSPLLAAPSRGRSSPAPPRPAPVRADADESHLRSAPATPTGPGRTPSPGGRRNGKLGRTSNSKGRARPHRLDHHSLVSRTQDQQGTLRVPTRTPEESR